MFPLGGLGVLSQVLVVWRSGTIMASGMTTASSSGPGSGPRLQPQLMIPGMRP